MHDKKSPSSPLIRLAFLLTSFQIAAACAQEPALSKHPQAARLIELSSQQKSLTDLELPEPTLDQQDYRLLSHFIRLHPDYRAYIPLMFLYEHHPQTWNALPQALRAKVICSAMANSIFLNDFGYLDTRQSADGPAAQALLSCGRMLIPLCTPLLDDKSPAPLTGTLEATLSRVYQYRRCDFAYRYICLALGKPALFQDHPQLRDEAIRKLKSELH